MNLLAIDQSLTNSGVVIHSEDNPNNLSLFSIKPKGNGIVRLMEIEQTLYDILHEHEIDILIMENYAFGRKFGLPESGELGCIIKRLCYTKKIKCIIITPTTHKKFTTGKGNTQKSLMLKSVYKVYGVDVDDDNLADAVSLLKTYQGYLQYTGVQDFGIKMNIKRKEVVKAMAKSLNN